MSAAAAPVDRPADAAELARKVQRLERELADAQRKLQRADSLLLRCEAFLPRVMAALCSDVRAHLGIDDRGFRVVRGGQ